MHWEDIRQVRLEEWQKYLDSQFLDDEPEAKSKPVSPAAGTASEHQTVLPLEEPGESQDAEETPSAVVRASIAVEIEEVVPIFRPPSAETEARPAWPAASDFESETPQDLPVFQAPPSEEDEPRYVPEPTTEDRPHFAAPAQEDAPTFRIPASVRSIGESGEEVPLFRPPKQRAESPRLQPPMRSDSPSSQEAAAPQSVPVFVALPEADVEIPSFARYLPPTHQAARAEAVTLPHAPPEQQAAPTPSRPVEAPTPSQARLPVPSSGSWWGKRTEEQSRETQTPPAEASRAKEREPQTTSAQTADTAALEAALTRRSPKHRARHARNVRPENVPSGLSAAELWATVPKHVQTLLALDRLDEQEIAQFSYKRPFAEKRHELIERLLDPILSLEYTARLLNVCPTTVRRYTNKGILTYYRKEPEHSNKGASSQDKETRQRRFRLSDILAFLETQQAALQADRAADAPEASSDSPLAEEPERIP